MMLPKAFIDIPIAHRALHDSQDGRPENSLAAIRSAMALGFGVEIDVQLSKDGQAMVFHDYDLQRLCGVSGMVRQKTVEELTTIRLTGSDETIPTLQQVLDLVDGIVPVLIEIKDQDGHLGPEIGELEEATAKALVGYNGPVAVMSFNPHSIVAMARLSPDVPRGLTTCNFDPEDWEAVPEDRRKALAEIPLFDTAKCCFISHQRDQLTNPRVTELKSRGVPILCWTIRSPEEEAEARIIADNVTFEGYHPA